MEIESRLALEILAESKLIKHQRRYNAVMRYIDAYGIIPNVVQIVRYQPKSEYIIRQVSVPKGIGEKINELEIQLATSQNDQVILDELDSLYDQAYRF
jgi:hypothetical protein